MDQTILKSIGCSNHLHYEEDWRVKNDSQLSCTEQVDKKGCLPLPCIDNLLDKLVYARFLSAIDLASGYHQVGLAKDA